jgi:serine/threonine protein kinase
MAIDDLHQTNIIHRDINPANIIYDAEKSEIKLFDFGISTSAPPSQLKPEVNRTLEGTLSYLSPEQTCRMNRSVDFRSDSYSLGVTLYQHMTHTTTGENQSSSTKGIVKNYAKAPLKDARKQVPK